MSKIIRSACCAGAGFASCAFLFVSLVAAANAADTVSAVKMDPSKLAGVNLPAGEAFIPPEDILDGNHRPRGEILYFGEELVVEIYEDDAATFKMDEPFPFDEFVQVLSGKLILTDADGESQEYIAGESLVVPKGFTGIWKCSETTASWS